MLLLQMMGFEPPGGSSESTDMGNPDSIPAAGDPAFRWENVASSLGVEVSRVRILIERLHSDLSLEDSGYVQLGDIADEFARAVASDQIRGAADAIATNLFEVRLHEQDYNALIPDEGLKMPDDVDSLVERARLDMHLTGFFQAFGSVLDCIAGTAIGVLRLPRSIQRADFNDLRILDPMSKEAAALESDHRSAWARLRTLLDQKRAGPPVDWLDWSLELRNALLHRAKAFTFNHSRPRESRIEVVAEEFPHWLIRYDPHLMAKPWLADMMMFAQSLRLDQAVIAEPVTQTLRGLFVALNDLTEAVADLLLEFWESSGSGRLKLPAPSVAWRASLDLDRMAFRGFAPGTLTATEIRVAPTDGVRFQLASRIREVIESSDQAGS